MPLQSPTASSENGKLLRKAKVEFAVQPWVIYLGQRSLPGTRISSGVAPDRGIDGLYL